MVKRFADCELGKLLQEISRKEEVNDDTSYRILGMRWYAKGLFVKEEKPGREIKAQYVYRVETGDIIYNRLFAWKGSFGVAERLHENSYVSNEFPCFQLKTEELNISYLKWYMSQQSFWDEVNRLSTGSSRQSRLRLKQERFLKLKIPVPPIEEQQRIVLRIEHVFAKKSEAIAIRESIKDNGEELLFSVISEISRNASRGILKEIAPVVRRQVDVQPNMDYPELGIRSFGQGTFHKPSIRGSDLGGKRIYRIEPGDLLFSNVFAWEGAIAVAQPNDIGRYGSHRFITCFPDPQKATANFLRYYFLSREGMAQIRAASPGAAGRNKTLGIKKLEAIKLPLPPLDAQKHFDKIAERVWRARAIQKQTVEELDAIMPAVLDMAFKGDL